MELEEKRLNNRSKEGFLEREIAERMNKIQTLRKSIQTKEEEFREPGSAEVSFSPSAPGAQYESLYSCLTSSLSQDSQDSPTLLSPDWLSSRSPLAKSLENITVTAPAPLLAEDSEKKRKYSRSS